MVLKTVKKNSFQFSSNHCEELIQKEFHLAGCCLKKHFAHKNVERIFIATAYDKEWQKSRVVTEEQRFQGF